MPNVIVENDNDLNNPEAILTSHKIYPLKSLGHIRATKINFEMDTEERHFLQEVKEMSREQMWAELEKKRLDELQKRG